VALNTTILNLVSCLIYKRWLRPSAFVRGIDVVNMATSVSRALDVLCMMFEIILYDTAVRRVVCGGWYFARMWGHVRGCIVSMGGMVWIHMTSLSPPRIIEVPIPSKESEQSCICV
jgi:hypothetical protein